MSSVVLLSGGLDSAANLALCLENLESSQGVYALHVNYGQRAEASEWRACQKLCEYYSVKLEKIDFEWLGKLGGSSLTDIQKSVPTLKTTELDQLSVTQKSADSVWVPNRNGILINLAAAWAERKGCSQVIVGFNREEAATFPDNSQAFLEQVTESLKFSTRNQVKAVCYTADLDKTQIVTRLRDLEMKFPFENIWSCYYSGEKICGTCESCQRFLRASQV